MSGKVLLVDRVSIVIRVTQAQKEQLFEAASYRGKTVQALLLEHVIEEIAKTRAEIEADDAYLARRKQRKRSSSGQGMGIRDRLEAKMEARRPAGGSTAAEDSVEVEQSPAPVPVQAPAPPPAPVPDELGRLAKYVAKGPEWSKDDRMREAVKILSASTDNSDERLRLAKALDEQVSLLEGNTVATESLLSKAKRALFG
jgi:hypothetical protein